MSQVLPEIKKQSPWENFGEAFSQSSANSGQNFAQGFSDRMMEREAEKKQLDIGKALSGMLGKDVTKLPKEFQSIILQNHLKGVQDQNNFENDLAKQYQKYHLENQLGNKKQEPKVNPKHVPVPPQIAKAKRDILAANPEVDSSQLNSLYEEAGIPPIHYEDEIKNLRQIESENRKPEKKEPPSQFQKTTEAEAAKDYISSKNLLAQTKNSIDNIKYLKEFSREKLSGLKGTGKALFNTGDAAEFNSLAFETIAPVLKIFNPVGAIPVAKLKIIQDIFTPHAGELQSTIDSKLNALERLGRQAEGRLQDKINLYEKYQGNIPQSELDQFEKESETLLEIISDQENKKLIKNESSENKKIKFDRNNPEHIERRDLILKKSGGNKDEARKELNKEFEL